ncbi:MAG TPA: hypothetical protein VJ579_04035 [Candidatus Paceibacterota bacterium]|nr:hypothetical protein [Candidatus Paceibacterota bacterium]
MTPTERKESWSALPASYFDAYTFGELKEGARFIVLPRPGDNRGGGGFKIPRHILIKTSSLATEGRENRPVKDSGIAKPEGRRDEFVIDNSTAILMIFS